jgi:hypothetical protein
MVRGGKSKLYRLSLLLNWAEAVVLVVGRARYLMSLSISSRRDRGTSRLLFLWGWLGSDASLLRRDCRREVIPVAGKFEVAVPVWILWEWEMGGEAWVRG